MMDAVKTVLSGFVGIRRKYLYEPQFRFVRVNGDPGFVISSAEEGMLGVMAVEIVDGRIANLRYVANPVKLARV